MLMVVFELRLAPVEGEAYLPLAAALRPELLRIDGFLGNERWRRLDDPAALLALSSWRDEPALLTWRRHAGHRIAQARGRGGVFTDYRLRVGEVDQSADEAITVATGAADPMPDAAYASLAGDGRWAVIVPGDAAPPEMQTHRLRIVRDYGMYRREQAPRA